jgi:hypothetical protein
MNDEFFFGLDEYLSEPAPTKESAIIKEDIYPWPARLTFDLAVGDVEEEDICDLYKITPLELHKLYEYAPFRMEVANHRRAIQREGVTFRMKARLQGEIYLENLHDIISSDSCPASVKLAAIQSVVKWGGLEPVNNTPSQSTTIVNNNKIEIQWLPITQAKQQVVNI